MKEERFQSVSEVIRARLRKLEENEAKLQSLRLMLQAGEDSSVAEDFDGDFFMAAMHEKHIK